MTGDGYYQKLFEALCKQSMFELARTAYEIMGMPIVVTDAAFIVRAKYPDDMLGDEQWDANVMNRQIEARFVKTFTDDDHFARHDEAGSAILTDWGHYEQAPRLTSMIRSSNGNVLGYFAGLATDVDVRSWHYEAADAIGAAFSVLMDASSATRFARSGFASPALYALLDGPAGTVANLANLPSEFFEQNPAPYVLFCARTRNPHNAPLEMYLGNELAQYFEHATQTVYEGDLYILAGGVSGDARGSVRSRLLVEELERQNLLCGLSKAFDDLGDIRVHSWEAASALDVGARLGMRGPLFHYDDFIIDIVCDALARQLPADALEHEIIARLRLQDRENGTSYLETLRTYYEMRFDKKRTCEALHIHRNTLQYRLDRIEEMAGEGVQSTGVLYSLYFALEDYRSRVLRAKGKAQRASRGNRSNLREGSK